MTRARVVVTLKDGVLDPQGEWVRHALTSLGFAQVVGVRIGKVLDVVLDVAPAEAPGALDAMCRALLANPVLEDVTYEVHPA